MKEELQALVMSQPKTKRFNSAGWCSGSTEGMYRSFVCYMCVEKGNFGRDCRRSARVCFHYGQEGHIRAHCPFLDFGEVLDPTPLAWQLHDSLHGTTGVSRTES